MYLSEKRLNMENEIMQIISNREHLSLCNSLDSNFIIKVKKLIKYIQQEIDIKSNWKKENNYDKLVDKLYKWIAFFDFYNVIISDIKIPLDKKRKI